MIFRFKGYDFDKSTFVANFYYADDNNLDYVETIHFVKNAAFSAKLAPVLERALDLSFLLIGTSYYKAHPTREVEFVDGMKNRVDRFGNRVSDKNKLVVSAEKFASGIDKFAAEFLNLVYHEGLSQFAFENELVYSDLVKFEVNGKAAPSVKLPYERGGILALQSGGKDSLLTATMLNERNLDWTALYVGSTNHYPEILNDLDAPVESILRQVDIEGLRFASEYDGYKNGHVPVTYILMSLAVVQAVLDRKNFVITSIGHEGEEPHSIIEDPTSVNLAVNHQWSKTWTAEKWFADYVHRYISPEFMVGSIIRGYSELKIAELFTEKCWKRYGYRFSSCNVANYRQKTDNSELTWCGDCAKCANSFLVFAPFVEPKELKELFGGKDLFAKSSLRDIFRGLLGIDGFEKPFECVGEIEELRQAYEMRKKGYKKLPFNVPKHGDFDYNHTYEHQKFVDAFFKLG